MPSDSGEEGELGPRCVSDRGVPGAGSIACRNLPNLAALRPLDRKGFASLALARCQTRACRPSWAAAELNRALLGVGPHTPRRLDKISGRW